VLLAPETTFDDGEMSLAVIRGDASRFQLIRAFMAMGKGEAAHLPFVQLYKVSAFDMQTEEGVISASGRDVPEKHLSVKLVPGVCRFWKD
jgi:diacylglycerol kinase family enzyme